MTMKFKFLVTFFSVAMLISCGTQTPLGGSPNHRYNIQPRRIILIQLPGLSSELLSLLKMNQSNAEWNSAWESMACKGEAWSFNLFNLRPDPKASTLSSLLGTPNIPQENMCRLTEKVPLWSVMQAQGLDTHIFEREVPEDASLLRLFECPKSPWSASKLTFWSMGSTPPKDAESFHFQSVKQYSSGQTYYDQSCSAKGCYAKLEQNLQVVFHQIDQKNKLFNFVLVRDWSLWNALKGQNVLAILQNLADWDELLKKIQARYLTDTDDGAIIITGDTSIPVELPMQGNEWREFAKSGKGLLFHRPSVNTPVWVWGARAENFCGQFDLSDFPRKLL